MTTVTKGLSQEDLENDVNVVAWWTTVDKVRWAAGVISGWLAGVFAMIVGGIISVTHGLTFAFPVKLLGVILLGRSATDYTSTSGFVAGAIICAFISGLWGFVYSHFVRKDTRWAIIGMGFTWSAFLWVFNWNLYMHSFKDISAAEIPTSAALAVCAAYGFGLSAVIAVVYPLFRGRR